MAKYLIILLVVVMMGGCGEESSIAHHIFNKMQEDSVLHLAFTPKGKKEERYFVIMRLNKKAYEESLKGDLFKYPVKGGDTVMMGKK